MNSHGFNQRKVAVLPVFITFITGDLHVSSPSATFVCFVL